MSKQEAQRILDLMKHADYWGKRSQLGNGDWVIVINFTFLWSFQDWEAYKRGTLPALKIRSMVDAKSA